MMIKALIFVALIAVAHGLPTFSKSGGPPDAKGVWFDPKDVSTFIQNGNEYSTSYDDGSADVGKYETWECNGKGAYKAIVSIRAITNSGKVSKETVCEVGKIDLETGSYKYAQNKDSCPTKYEYTAYRSGSWGIPCGYKCT